MNEELAGGADRPNPGAYSPRERMMRLLRHEKVDRLPIVPTALSPFTWHMDFPCYHPIIEVAKRHCEFMPTWGVNMGFRLCEPAVLDMKTDKRLEGDRKIHSTTLKTPKGELTEVRIHDPAVGSWATTKFFVNNDDDLAAWESLPFAMARPDVSGLAALAAKVGDAGLEYGNGITDALGLATGCMGEEYRIMFCFSEWDRLRRLVDRQQQRLGEFVTSLLDAMDGLTPAGGEAGAGAARVGPVFRWYAIEPFVEPIQPPRFVDEFIVPYDREIVRLIHDRGRHVIMHCHGRLKAQISRIVQIGVDGVDCVESPPANDATLAEMMAMAAGRLFLWGYIQFEDLAHKSGEEIEEQVRRAVEAGGADGRYVLGQAASPYSGDISPLMRHNWIRMIEAGVKYGRH